MVCMACARLERPHMKEIALLRESADTSDWVLAVSVLSVLKAGVQHDQRSFSIALKASGRALAWEAACCLLVWMERVGTSPDSITYSSAEIAMGQRWRLSVGLVAEMKKRRILQDVVNYGSVINACQQAQEWSSALLLLGNLALAAISANAIIAGSLISACVVWKEALAIFGGMQSRRVQPNSVIFNAMASSYEETGQWVSALTCLRNAGQSWTVLDIISFNSVVSAGEKASCWRPALDLLSRIRARRIQQSLVSFNAAISACEKSGQWDAALGLSQSVALRSISGDIVTIGAAMNGCQASGEWCWAIDLLKRSTALSLRHNRIVLNTAIAASQGQWQLSAGLMCEMATGFLVPGTLTLGAAIGACDEWSQWSMVLRLFKELQECQLRRSDLIHNSAVTAASDGSRWSGALELLRELRAVRVQQDVLSFSSSVAACRDEWEAALSVVEEMAQAAVSKDVISLSYAVAACERGRVPLADVLELIEVTAHSALWDPRRRRAQWLRCRVLCCCAWSADDGEVDDALGVQANTRAAEGFRSLAGYRPTAPGAQERGQGVHRVQCLHKCLRESGPVATRPGSLQRDGRYDHPEDIHYLQRDCKCLRERARMGASLDNSVSNGTPWRGAMFHHLQRLHGSM
eukprot:s830_g10.t4